MNASASSGRQRIDQIDLTQDLCHIERLSHWHDRDLFHRLVASGPS